MLCLIFLVLLSVSEISHHARSPHLFSGILRCTQNDMLCLIFLVLLSVSEISHHARSPHLFSGILHFVQNDNNSEVLRQILASKFALSILTERYTWFISLITCITRLKYCLLRTARLRLNCFLIVIFCLLFS